MKPISEMTLAECLEAIRNLDMNGLSDLDNNKLADRIHDLTTPHLVKEQVCTSCLSFGISDVNCICVTETYETVELEFEECPLCHHTENEYADTPFNDEQLKDYPKWEDLEDNQ
jgi:hypothetical protein